MTPEEIQEKDAEIMTRRHFAEHGTATPEDICRTQNESMPRGVRETTFGTQPIDRALSQATPRPSVKPGLSGGMQRTLVISAVICLGILGLIAVKVVL